MRIDFLSLAAGFLCLLPTPQLSSKEPEQWIGKEVMPKTLAISKVDDASEPVEIDASDELPWKVTRERSGSLWVGDGWVAASDVIVLSDASTYYKNAIPSLGPNDDNFVFNILLWVASEATGTIGKHLAEIEHEASKRVPDGHIRIPKEAAGAISLLLRLRGQARLAMKSRELALQDANDAVACDPNSFKARRFRADVYKELHNYSKAVAELSKEIQLRGAKYNSSDAFHQRAHLWSSLNEPEKAIADFTRAIQILDTAHNLGLAG